MNRKTILQRLDDIVRWTAIPQLWETPPRRRSVRWSATLALTLAFGGFVVMAAGGFSDAVYFSGDPVLMIGFAIAAFVQIWGPLKPFGAYAERVDEWDRTARARSYLVTFAVFSAVTMLGLFLLLGLAVSEPSAPAMMRRGIDGLLFTLMTIAMAMPAAYASWRWRWGDD